MSKKYNEKGEELFDNTPVAIPVKFSRPPTRFEEFAQYIRTASVIAQASGYESIEEAEDFDIPDDPDTMPNAPWELHYDTVLGKEITKAEFNHLEASRQAFTKKHGTDKPWWQRLRQKAARSRANEPNPKTPSELAPKEPPVGSKT